MRSLGFLTFGSSVCMAARLLAPTAILFAPSAILLAAAAILRAATAIALITPPGRTSDVSRRFSSSLCQKLHAARVSVPEREESRLGGGGCPLHVHCTSYAANFGRFPPPPAAPSRVPAPTGHLRECPPCPLSRTPHGRSKCQESAGSRGEEGGEGKFIVCRCYP